MLQIITELSDIKAVAVELYRLAIQDIAATSPKATAPEIMTGQQLSERLDIDIQTLAKWRQKGKIPYLQLGTNIRYDFNKVIEALEVTKKKGSLR
jgi:hypothetical protein